MTNDAPPTTNDTTEPPPPSPPPSKPPSKIRTFLCWLYSSIDKPEYLPLWVTAAATFGLVIFALYAWTESQKTTKTLEGQLEEMKDEQRPWVGISGLSAPPPKPGENFFIQLGFRNGGKTPAFKVRAHFDAHLQPAGYTPSLPTEPCSPAACGGGMLLIPDVPIGKSPHVSAFEMTPQIIQTIAENNEVISLLGRIDYEDMAGGKHWTLVCFDFH